VVIRTLSKAYGLAGLRTGFAVGDPKVVAELEKSRGPYKVSRVAERAALSALEDESGWVENGIAEVRESRSRVARALTDLGHTPLDSEANFLLVPVRDATRTTADLRRSGIAVRPFPNLPGLGDAIRVSVGRWDYMEPFLEAMSGLEGGGA
jgi:histidinol-phosphate/aromatic aminotransferase/cobyric acid decarboxylase-like protein